MTQISDNPDEFWIESVSSKGFEARCKTLERENLERKTELTRLKEEYDERIRDLERRNRDLFQERDNLKNYCEFLVQICKEADGETCPRAPPNTPTTEERKSLGAVSTADEWVEPMPEYFGETLIHFGDKRDGARCPSLGTYSHNS